MTKDNPYEPPDAVPTIARSQGARPNILDWLFAIAAGILAFVVLFPTTCIGSSVAVLPLQAVIGNSNGIFVFCLVVLTSFGVSAYVAVKIVSAYLRATRKKNSGGR